MVNNLQQRQLKLIQKEQLEKTAEATGDLIRNKIADKITRASKISPQNNSEKNKEEILRERYISPEKREEMIGLKKKMMNHEEHINKSQIKTERSNLCDCSDAYVHVKRTI